MNAIAQAKQQAADAALGFVKDGMILGLGSGSTAELFIASLGEKIAKGGFSVQGVPTSEASARAAKAAGVPLLAIDEVERLDLDIDGADEVDPAFNLVKGGGGCLLHARGAAGRAEPCRDLPRARPARRCRRFARHYRGLRGARAAARRLSRPSGHCRRFWGANRIGPTFDAWKNIRNYRRRPLGLQGHQTTVYGHAISFAGRFAGAPAGLPGSLGPYR